MTFPPDLLESTDGQARGSNSSDGDSAGETQRRQYPRRPTTAHCWITDPYHTAYLRMQDISLGGLSVGALLPFPTESEIEVRIELPFGRQVRARGYVVWRKDMRLGARFLEILEGQGDLDALCSESAS